MRPRRDGAQRKTGSVVRRPPRGCTPTTAPKPVWPPGRLAVNTEKVDPNAQVKLSSGDIFKGMTGVKSRVSRCSDKHDGKGSVVVAVKVGTNGKVTSAKVKSSPNKELGSCVASAAKRAKFPAIQQPSSFNWAFPVR